MCLCFPFSWEYKQQVFASILQASFKEAGFHPLPSASLGPTASSIPLLVELKAASVGEAKSSCQLILYINLKVYVFLLIARCSTGLYPVRYEFRKYKYYIRTTQRSEAFTECRAALHPGTATGQDDCGWFAAAYGCIWVQRRHMCLCQRWTCFE